MTWRSIAIIWIAGALVWVGAWRMWKGAQAGGSGADLALAPCFDSGRIDWEGLDRLEIIRPDVTYEFARSGDGWTQVKPFAYPLDPLLVKQALEQLSSLKGRGEVVAEELQEGEFLQSAGLDANATRIVLHWKDGEASVALGRRLPAGYAWLAMDGKPQVARATAHDLFVSSDLRQLRRGALFARADIECKGLHCQAQAPDGSPIDFEVERSGPDWMVTRPARTRADSEAVERWLDALARSRATGFVADSPESLAPFGLAKPQAVVEIRSVIRTGLESGEISEVPVVERLEIGSPVRPGAQEHFARLGAHPQAVFELDAAAVAAAVPQVLSLLDPTATGLRPQDIRAIEITPVEGDPVRIERSGAQWKVSWKEGLVDGDPAVVSSLLSKLCTLRATDLAMSKPPAELHVADFSVEGFDGRVLVKLSLAREAGAGRWGIDDGSGVLRIFPASLTFNLDPEDFELSVRGADPALVPPVPLPR